MWALYWLTLAFQMLGFILWVHGEYKSACTGHGLALIFFWTHYFVGEYKKDPREVILFMKIALPVSATVIAVLYYFYGWRWFVNG